ncbi:MAG: TetR family transcriptional regulator [Dermatophilaceae bacterium]
MSATTPRATGGGTVRGGDGRSRRWDEHRTTRRHELVDATLRAIQTHGAGVGMDDIAAVAGTSKTVFYRHFTDRAGLYAAVATRVDDNIMRDVTAAAGVGDGGRSVIASAIDAYLRLVEEEPEIYRFVVTAPILDRAGVGDPSGPVSAHIAEEITALLESALGVEAAEPVRSRVWAYGVVGMVRAAADDWLTRGGAASGVTREELAGLLTDLAWSGLSPAWS